MGSSNFAIKIFENPEFGLVRTLKINDEPWFVGKDVAEVLGYAKARNAISNHVDSDDKKDAPIQGNLGGVQNMTIINESGVFSLIMSSKLPKAKQFKHWVTSEVLPTLRKTGGYMSDVDMFVETYFGTSTDDQKTIITETFKRIKNLQDTIINKNNTIDVLTTEIMTISNRDMANRVVRCLANKIHKPYATVWNSIYAHLNYKYNIALKKRGKQPYLSHLKDDEWEYLQKTIATIIEQNGFEPSSFIEESRTISKAIAK